MIPILQKEEKLLRHRSKEVALSDIGSTKISKVIAHMKKALLEQKDGVAIAAPQIGIPLRIFVVSGKVFAEDLLQETPDKNKKAKKPDDITFINPEIMKLSKKKAWVPEGCLSVRWLYGKVSRSTHATVKALDEHGEKFTRGAGGLLAQIFQHEIDHLDGILFIDKAKDIEEVIPNQNNLN